jgi:hypothetical protein
MKAEDLMKYLMVSGLSVLFLGFASAIAASAQTVPNSTITSGGARSTGNWINYPSGTRLEHNGTIYTPNGRMVLPATTVNHGDGTTTYYYPDGTRITTNNNTVSPSGTYLTPGTLNGGLRTR